MKNFQCMQQDSKNSLKEFPLGRGGSGFLNIGNKTFSLIGGSSRKQHFDDIWVLELQQQEKSGQVAGIKWQRVKFNSANSDNQEFLTRNSHSAFYSKALDTIFVFGGSKLLDHYNDIYEIKIYQEGCQQQKSARYVYDSVVKTQLSQNLTVVTGEWPLKRASFASSQTKNGFVIHGGANSQNGPLDDCLEFNYSDKTWKRILTEGKPDSRQMHSCSYYKQSDQLKSVYIFGGRVAKKPEISDQIFKLDIKKQVWTKLDQSMPRASCAHATVRLSSQHILFYGGTNGGIPFYDDFLIFNLKTLKWRIVDFDKLKKKKYFGDEQTSRQRISAMCAVDEGRNYLVVFGGAGLEKEYNDVWVLSVNELLDDNNSDEIDKIA